MKIDVFATTNYLGFSCCCCFFLAKSVTYFFLLHITTPPPSSCTWKTHENNHSRGHKWSKVSSPTPPPLSPHLSAPLFKKRSVLLSNSKRKKHLEILTCLIALIIFIKRLIWSYHIPLISFAVYKICIQQMKLKEYDNSRLVF